MKLTAEHQRVWDKLRTLPDGERILGTNLQIECGIDDERTLKRVMDDLRSSGLFVSGSKSKPMGYCEIRTVKELDSYLKKRRQEHAGELRKLDEMERQWYDAQSERMRLNDKSE